MSDTVFRTEPMPSVPEPTSPLSDPVPNQRGADPEVPDLEPIEDPTDGVMESLELGNDLHSLPEEDRSKLSEIGNYVLDSLKSRGVPPTKTAFDKTLTDLKIDLGIDPDAASEVVIDRLGGVIQAWRDLSFVRDPQEKRVLFMKLARQPTSKAMHQVVFEAMEKQRIWQ